MNVLIDLIGYCGENCAICWGYRGTVSDAAQLLRSELRKGHFKNFWNDVPGLGRYDAFKKPLDQLTRMRCPEGCRGSIICCNPLCPIRQCCKEKQSAGCWECADFEACGKLSEGNRKDIKELREAIREVKEGAP